MLNIVHSETFGLPSHGEMNRSSYIIVHQSPPRSPIRKTPREYESWMIDQRGRKVAGDGGGRMTRLDDDGNSRIFISLSNQRVISVSAYNINNITGGMVYDECSSSRHEICMNRSSGPFLFPSAVARRPQFLLAIPSIKHDR